VKYAKLQLELKDNLEGMTVAADKQWRQNARDYGGVGDAKDLNWNTGAMDVYQTLANYLKYGLTGATEAYYWMWVYYLDARMPAELRWAGYESNYFRTAHGRPRRDGCPHPLPDSKKPPMPTKPDRASWVERGPRHDIKRELEGK
jgi:hypothetical protein